MKTIFITISRGSLIRNFFQSGVIEKIINHNIRVVVLTPNYKDKEIWIEYKCKNLFFEPLLDSKQIKCRRLINELLKGAAFNKTIHSFYRYRGVGEKTPNKSYYILRMLFLAPLRILPYAKRIVRLIDFKVNPQYEHDYLFKKYDPDIVFTTTPHAYPDVGVLKSAKRFKVKMVTMPKSWDNPSIVLFNTKADYIFVWCQFVKEQVTKLQGYSASEVVITGIPQYDYYFNKNNLLSREEFCKKFGFDPAKKIILYGSGGASTGYESYYPDLIRRYIAKGRLKNAQVLIRYHTGYTQDKEQYNYLDRYQECAVDDTDKGSDKFKDYWDVSTNHLNNLYNSLYHADVCVTIASTLIIDSIACGTPVINIGFDAKRNTNMHYSVKRFYTRDYTQALTGNNASWLAGSKEQLLEYLKRILEKGERRSDLEIKKFIKYFMYKNDGNSAQRVADTLVSLTNKTRK